MSVQSVLFIVFGTLFMMLIALLFRRYFALSEKKCVLLSILLTVAGVVGVLLMFFFENGHFGGLSFFGAVFFVPLLLIPFARLLRIPYRIYLDLSAPLVSAMLAVMKVNCVFSGCCQGKVVGFDAAGQPVLFPSQICEMVTALIIMGVLLALIRKGKLTGRLYPLFMVLYGATRFVLNFFRDTEDFLFGMAIGNIWSIVSVLIGLVFLFLRRKPDAAADAASAKRGA